MQSYSTRFLTALMLSLTAMAAFAEHEADHRYTVEGFVLDGNDEPRTGVKVIVKGREGLLGQDATDYRGFYSIQLHLHNDDLSKKLTVEAGGRKSDIEVTFDPGDRTAPRIHRLSFIGAAVTESDLGFRGPPAWLYILIGVVALLVGVRIIERRVKRQKRREQERQKRKKKKYKRGKSRSR